MSRGAAAAKVLIGYNLSQVSSEFGAESQGFFFAKEKDTFGPLSPSFTTEVCQKPAANRQKEALARLASLIDCTAAKEPSGELGRRSGGR